MISIGEQALYLWSRESDLAFYLWRRESVRRQVRYMCSKRHTIKCFHVIAEHFLVFIQLVFIISNYCRAYWFFCHLATVPFSSTSSLNLQIFKVNNDIFLGLFELLSVYLSASICGSSVALVIFLFLFILPKTKVSLHEKWLLYFIPC